MISELLILLGIVINAIGTVSYILGTIKGKIKPNKVTFFVWSLAPFVAFLAQIQKGVGVQSWMTLSVGIFPLSIFLASFLNKKAYWKLLTRDIFCGILSLFGLILWYITKEGNIAIIFSMFSEVFATIPTIIKSYYHPETESAWPWLASVISGILTLVTITHWTFAAFAFPLLYTIEMFLLFLFIQFRIGKNKE